MKVFLFELSPRCINLMNLFIKPVQLVLSLLYILLLDASFMFMYSCTHDTIFNTCYFDLDLSIHMCFPCTLLGIRHTTRWGVLTPLNPHVQILELGACGFSQLLIRVAQQKHNGSAKDQFGTLPFQPPCAPSSFPVVTREAIL